MASLLPEPGPRALSPLSQFIPGHVWLRNEDSNPRDPFGSNGFQAGDCQQLNNEPVCVLPGECQPIY